MKGIFTLFKKFLFCKHEQTEKEQERDLEKKVVEGARKAVRDYRRVFERLADYDRT